MSAALEALEGSAERVLSVITVAGPCPACGCHEDETKPCPDDQADGFKGRETQKPEGA